MSNPLLVESPYPYGAPQFDKIKTEHYLPAFKQGIQEAKADIDNIVNCPDAPTFANTIEALEFSGRTLGRVSDIFFNILEADSDDELQAVAEEVSPMLTEYSMYVSLNAPLFSRIRQVYEQRETLALEQDQKRLLEQTYKSFSRQGANLSDEDKAIYGKYMEELSLLTLKFGKNVLAATNAYSLHITDEKDLAGLPDYVRDAGKTTAKEKNLEGWVFTLDRPSYGPFMQYCDNPELRRQMYLEYNRRATSGENDNSQTVRRIAELRLKIAGILGYETWADYVLEENMAKTRKTVNDFLESLMTPSLPFAEKDVKNVYEYALNHGFRQIAQEHGQPSDRLMKVYDVKDKDGSHLALFYADFFPRESKRGGAWMTEFRGQRIENGVEQRPLVSIVTNFTKPTENAPSLLTHDELNTFLHEFGHSLHGMFAEGRYPSLCGTNVARDFVELPSQIMENWAFEPAFLETFAKDYRTGEVIPGELLERIVNAKNYLSGYYQVRQLDFGILDMAWHTLESMPQEGTIEFETRVLEPYRVLPYVSGTAISTSFSHIFSGGYSAGYYSYKWAEVLEADAFSLFEQNGIFDKATAESFRKEILSRGDTEDPAVLYRNFRGRDPQPQALMKKLGLE